MFNGVVSYQSECREISDLSADVIREIRSQQGRSKARVGCELRYSNFSYRLAFLEFRNVQLANASITLVVTSGMITDIVIGPLLHSTLRGAMTFSLIRIN